jgi:hypothetical protein
VRVSDAHRDQWRREIAAGSAWANDAPRRYVDLGAAIAVGAALLDAVFTYAALHGSVFDERNPIVAAVMRTVGVVPTLMGATALRIAIVVLLAFLATRAVRRGVRIAAAVTVIAVTLWWCAVVFANVAVVARVT